jgi:MFS superfamily sulfate permease-like transporter
MHSFCVQHQVTWCASLAMLLTLLAWQDFLVIMVTSAVALVFSIDSGIITGVALSTCLLLFKVSYPKLRILGQ